MASAQAKTLSFAALQNPQGERRKAIVHASFRPPFRQSDLSLSLQKIRASPANTATRESSKITKQAEGLSSAAGADDLAIQKLYAIMETAAARAEMHDIIGTQRNNWNHLFLNSLNSMTLAASISAGLSVGGDLDALRISSTILYTAATVLLLAVNYIQPSQLAEEQRNAARLFRRLEKNIRTMIEIGTPTSADVDDALNRVLSLDKAYPLSLIPGMLEKFPEKVEPTVWWPKQRLVNQSASGLSKGNGWSPELEALSADVLETLKKIDTAEYLKVGTNVLKINKFLAISGPTLTGLAAAGAAVMHSAPALGPLPVFLAVVGGALATVVNTLEHGAQVGMIFEICRNCAGYYRQMEEDIELNLSEPDVGKREHGKMFELKLALRLRRSRSDLRRLPFSRRKVNMNEQIHAGRLF